jgi:hypothetical protein
MMSWLARLAA